MSDLTPDKRARLRTEHVPMRQPDDPDVCRGCYTYAPCVVTQLLDALDAAEARIAAVEALTVDPLVCTCDGADDIVLVTALRAALDGDLS